MSTKPVAQLAVAVLVLLAGSACGPSSIPERVLLVTIDTLRADSVGCYGAPVSVTPFLDSLAEQGVRFAQAIAPTPITLPSHATLLTALEPPRHGAHHNGTFQLEEGIPTLAERFHEAGFATAAFVSSYVLDREFGLSRGFDVYNDEMSGEAPEGMPRILPERLADATVDAVLAWLPHAPSRFFLWLHLYDPHQPRTPPEPYASRLSADPYLAEIAFADAQVGRLLSAIAERYGEGGTVVALTSDHGESLGDHGELTHGYGLYDVTQRVPLLLRGPEIPRGQVVQGLVRLSDVPATLLDLAALPPFPDAEGRSLAPLWRGDRGPPRTAYLQTLTPHYEMGWSPLFGVRTDHWKYVRAPRPELYDLTADPAERSNQATNLPDRVAELDALLEELIAEARPARPNRAVSPDVRDQLAALGYIFGSESTPVELGEVSGLNPRDNLAHLRARLYARHLLDIARPAEALETLAGIEPAGFEVQRLRGMAYLATGNLSAAETALRQATQLDPGRHQGFFLLGLALERQGRLEEAAAAHRNSRERGPGIGQTATALGRIAEASEESSRAEVLYREARASRVPDPEATWLLAGLLLETGRRQEAEALLAELGPTERSAEVVVARIAAAELVAGSAERALEWLTHLPADPKPIWSLRLEADCYEALGRLEQALNAREAILTRTPDDLGSRNDLAWSLALLGRNLDRALALSLEATQVPEPEPAALDTLAVVRLRRGEAGKALSVLDAALPRTQGPGRAALQLTRAEVLLQLGRIREARSALEASREGRSAPSGPSRRQQRIEALLREAEAGGAPE